MNTSYERKQKTVQDATYSFPNGQRTEAKRKHEYRQRRNNNYIVDFQKAFEAFEIIDQFLLNS